MLCSRSASFTSTTRTSVTMASSILRTLSTWRTSGETSSRRLILVTPSTRRAVSGPNSAAMSGERDARVFDDVMQQGGAECGDVEPQVRQDVRYFERMRKIGFTGFADLRLVLLGSESKCALQRADVFARAILPHAFQQLGKPGLQATLGRGTPCRRPSGGAAGPICRAVAMWEVL